MNNNENKELTDEQVTAYLAEHLDFFHYHESLLAKMTIPHTQQGVVSLVERQVGILRERNIELRQRLNSLLDTAKDNDGLFDKMRCLVLELIEVRSLDALFPVLYKSLKEDFSVDTASLLLFDKQVNIKPPSTQYVRVVKSDETESNLKGLLQGNKSVCGVFRENELEFLFKHNAKSVGSAALVPLNYKGRHGLLAIGSQDVNHFRSSMGTLFINHIGDVLSRTLQFYLRDLPVEMSA